MKATYTALQPTMYPVYEFYPNSINADQVADNIKQVLQQYDRANQNSYRIQGFYATHSDKFINRSVRLFDDLIDIIEKKSLDISRDNDQYFDNYGIVPRINDSWVVSYQKGDSASWHKHSNHDNTCFNAVYYASAEDQTPIVFENHKWSLKQFNQDINPDNLMNYQRMCNIEIKPRPGMLLLWPGMANHMVPEVTSDKQRLAFVATLSYVAK